MPAEPFVDLAALDLNRVALDREAIRKINRQRFEMEQLTAVVLVDRERKIVAGYKDVTAEEFWVRGHIPGRPLMPGVLMIEAAAQLSSAAYKLLSEESGDRFIGFGGVEGVKFRGPVVPPARLVLLVKAEEIRSRRAVFAAQSFLERKMVFEGTIIGMPL